MRELERLVEALQRHWLLRKYVNPTTPPPSYPLSQPAGPEKKPLKSAHSRTEVQAKSVFAKQFPNAR
jgi:hypothetical protein